MKKMERRKNNKGGNERKVDWIIMNGSENAK